MFFTPPEVKTLSRYSEFGSHLQHRHFLMMVTAAIALHLIVIAIYSMKPREEPITIPVRVLNIKLSGGASADEAMPKPSEMPGYQPDLVTEAIENMRDLPSALHKEKLSPGGRHKALIAILSEGADKKGTKGDEATSAAHYDQKPKKYVRENTPADTANEKAHGNGSGLKGTKEGQEIVRNYEQEISLWLEKHKIYPETAKQQGVEGSAVVRIRINHEGRIVFSVIELSSGNRMIDDAVMAMVHDSDPVPRVPDNYPESGDLEFLVPISFKLK